MCFHSPIIVSPLKYPLGSFSVFLLISSLRYIFIGLIKNAHLTSSDMSTFDVTCNTGYFHCGITALQMSCYFALHVHCALLYNTGYSGNS